MDVRQETIRKGKREGRRNPYYSDVKGIHTLSKTSKLLCNDAVIRSTLLISPILVWRSVRVGGILCFQKAAIRHLAAVRMWTRSLKAILLRPLGRILNIKFAGSNGIRWEKTPTNILLIWDQKGLINKQSQKICGSEPGREPQRQHSPGRRGLSLCNNSGVWYQNISTLYWFSLYVEQIEVLAAVCHILCHTE